MLTRRTGVIAALIFAFSSTLYAADLKNLADVDPEQLTLKESQKIFKKEADVAGAFAEKRKVLITGYRIGFMTHAIAGVHEEGSRSQISNFSGQDSVTYYSQNPDKHLVAIARFAYDEALAQEITEEAYADLRARLQAIGRDVVSMDTLKDSEGYRALELAQADPSGQFSSRDDNGGLADVSYVARTPADIPMWFLPASPLDTGGAMSKVRSAFSQKNIKPLMALGAAADAVIVDVSARVRPAWVMGARGKMLRAATVKADPYLVVLPEPIIIQTYRDTPIGKVPSKIGALRFNSSMEFNYGYDYGELLVDDKTVDKSYFTPAYERTTIVQINPDREKFKAKVLHALKMMNASIALWAKENPAG